MALAERVEGKRRERAEAMEEEGRMQTVVATARGKASQVKTTEVYDILGGNNRGM